MTENRQNQCRVIVSVSLSLPVEKKLGFCVWLVYVVVS